MKWVTLMLLCSTLASCAHYFHPERSTASAEEEKQYRRTNVEPSGSRF